MIENLSGFIRKLNPSKGKLGITFEEGDVPVGKKIFLSFKAQLTGILGILHGTSGGQFMI